MKKAVLLCLVSYILGILAFEKLNVSAFVFICIAAVLTVIFRCAFFGVRKNKCVIAVCIFFIFGAVYTSAVMSQWTHGLGDVAGKRVEVTARVTEADTENEYYDKYKIKIMQVSRNGEKVDHASQTVMLSLAKFELKNPYVYKYGDVISVKGELGKIENPLNEGEPNFAQISLPDGIVFEMVAENRHSELLYNDINYFQIHDLAYMVRTYLLGEIDKYFDGDEASLLKGMLLSEKSFGKDYYNSLSNSGMAHITVASGLHAGCVAAIILWLCFALRIRKRYTYTIAIVVLWVFAFLQGLTPSIIRAVIMLSLCMIAQLLSRDYDKLHTLTLAAFAMLVSNPYMIYDAGFALSFFSVLGIVFFEPIMTEFFGKVTKFKKLVSLVSITLSVQVMLLPFLAMYFNKVSPYALLANLLIVPVLTIVLAVGFIFAATSFLGGFVAGTVSFVLWLFLKYMNIVIYVISILPFSADDVFGMDVIRVILYYLLAMSAYMFFAKGNRRYNIACLILSAAIAFGSICGAIYDMQFVHVDFINVGQGDAALIQIPYGKTVVIDGGGSSPASERDIGEEIFVPYIKRKGINKIDYAILSHYDKDHAQGIAAALRLMRVDNLILPYRGDDMEEEKYKTIIEDAAHKQGTNVMYFKEGDSLTVGGACFDVYAPTLQNAKNRGFEENDKSLVVKMTYGKTSFLFTGDIEEAAEAKLVHYGDKIRADVLKVAHHGSENSTNAKFIMTTSPSYAIISVGRDNVYELPDTRVVNSLIKEDVKIYTTAYSGTVSFRVSTERIEEIDTFYGEGEDEEQIYLKSGESVWRKNPWATGL